MFSLSYTHISSHFFFPSLSLSLFSFLFSFFLSSFSLFLSFSLFFSLFFPLPPPFLYPIPSFNSVSSLFILFLHPHTLSLSPSISFSLSLSVRFYFVPKCVPKSVPSAHSDDLPLSPSSSFCPSFLYAYPCYLYDIL